MKTVNIEIRKTEKCSGDNSLFLTFDYDQELIANIRELPTRYWNGDTKEWEVPFNKLQAVLDRLSTCKIEIHDGDGILFKEEEPIELTTNYVFKTNPYQHQLEGFNYGMSHKKWLLGDDMGLGKALALDTKIYTYPTGYKLMRDIEVGDYVYGKNGKPVKVTNTYYHKDVEMYRFTFSDGVSIDCCKDHLWEIHTQHGYKVVDTNWFLQKNQFGVVRKDNLFSGGSYNYYIDRCEPVQFKFTPVELDPYVLGALLGDGSLSGGSISFTTKDDELVNNINMCLPRGYILHSSNSMENITYNIVRLEHTTKPNIIKSIIKELNLLNANSHNKFIPDKYKYNSPEIRLSILQGLLDTDGYATKDNLVQYTTVSKQLAGDVRFLVESLGGMCTWHECPCGYNGKITGIAYTLTVKIDDPTTLFRLTRKKSLLKPRHFKPRRQIVKIEKIENADAKCITVDSQDHLYLAEHFVVTHNTKQVIDIAVAKKQEYGYKHCLIICGVNGLKWTWWNEIKTHSNETGYILGQRTNSKRTYVGGNKEKLEDLNNLPDDYFLITNVESLRDDKILAKLVELCKKEEIGMVACDEMHKCANSASQQGHGVLKIKCKDMIAMTGTPLMNRPTDLYMILKWLGYETHSFYAFKNYYCEMGGFGGYQVVGYKHLDELQSQLDSIMLRRLKEDVLDLPEKTFVDEYVEMGIKQKKIYHDVLNELRGLVDKIKLSPNPLAMMIRLRQATGYTGILSSTIKESAKIDRLEEIVEEAIDNNKKVIIFSNWTEMTEIVHDRLFGKYKVLEITGDVSEVDRKKAEYLFQTDPDYKILIGTTGAMGTGLTLTAASVMCFLDHPWNAALYGQAVDRFHRIGQNQNVTVYNLITKGTIDERIWKIVKAKGKLSDIIVDQKYDLDDADSLVDYLLSEGGEN